MTIAGIPLTVFTVVGGALAIGVGFGSQNIVNNFISGVILLVEQPIKVGDIIEVDGMMGTIQSIGTRSTKIKTIEDKIFIIPNSFFLEKAVLNSTFQSPVVRTMVEVGVAYGSDVRMVENACLDILLNTDGIKQTPMPIILFENFGDSALNFKLIFWADISSENLAVLRSTVRFRINDRFNDLGIEIAFPQRDMNLKVSKPLEVKMLS
jgi:potassium-dependent mechanosensitive channel